MDLRKSTDFGTDTLILHWRWDASLGWALDGNREHSITCQLPAWNVWFMQRLHTSGGRQPANARATDSESAYKAAPNEAIILL